MLDISKQPDSKPMRDTGIEAYHITKVIMLLKLKIDHEIYF